MVRKDSFSKSFSSLDQEGSISIQQFLMVNYAIFCNCLINYFLYELLENVHRDHHFEEALSRYHSWAWNAFSMRISTLFTPTITMMMTSLKTFIGMMMMRCSPCSHMLVIDCILCCLASPPPSTMWQHNLIAITIVIILDDKETKNRGVEFRAVVFSLAIVVAMDNFSTNLLIDQ